MTVKAIVCRKGTDVITIDPTVSLANAAKTLSKRGIGALIITGPTGRSTAYCPSATLCGHLPNAARRRSRSRSVK